MEAKSKRTLDISEVKIRYAGKNEMGLIGWASCVINNSLYLDNISIRRNLSGKIYLSCPSRKTKCQSDYYYFKPISHEATDKLLKSILKELK